MDSGDNVGIFLVILATKTWVQVLSHMGEVDDILAHLWVPTKDVS